MSDLPPNNLPTAVVMAEKYAREICMAVVTGFSVDVSHLEIVKDLCYISSASHKYCFGVVSTDGQLYLVVADLAGDALQNYTATYYP